MAGFSRLLQPLRWRLFLYGDLRVPSRRHAAASTLLAVEGRCAAVLLDDCFLRELMPRDLSPGERRHAGLMTLCRIDTRTPIAAARFVPLSDGIRRK